MVDTHDKLDRAAFEAEIGDYDERYRLEVRVDQITPVWGTRREAYLLSRPGAEGAVEAILDRFSRPMRGIFSPRTSAEVHGEHRGRDGAAIQTVPPGRLFVSIRQFADRNNSGYENIYRGICELAPHVEDCRFVISEDYETWVDEYRIEAGELRFERGWAEDVYVSELLDYFEGEALRRPDDREWVAFAARELGAWAAFHIGEAEKPTRPAAEREGYRAEGRMWLERAARLDPDEPVVCAQMGRLLRLEGRPGEAQRWFERNAAHTSEPELLLAAVFAALEDRDHEAARGWLRRLLAASPEHQAAHQLLAVLANRDGDHEGARTHARRAFELAVASSKAGDRHEMVELLHRNELHREVLEIYLVHAEPKTEAEREALAAELLCWAQLFRIKMCADIAKPESTRLAEEFYERAIAVHPLDGRIHSDYALFCRQAGREGSDELLAAALKLNRDHLDALSELGGAAFEAREWSRAIELLGRAVERRLATRTGGYRRDYDGSRLVAAFLQEGNRLLELGGEANLEAADGLFERGLEFVDRLGFERAEWFALVLRRSAAHTLLGRHEQALAFAEAAQELRPDSVHAMSEIAGCLHGLGHDEDALAAVELAAELDDGYWHVPYVRACILARASAPVSEITALLARAIELEPSCRGTIAADSDFAAIRDSPEFRAVVD